MKIEWTEKYDIHTAYIPAIGERLTVVHSKNAYMVSVFSDVQDEAFFDLEMAKQFAVRVARRKLQAAMNSLKGDGEMPTRSINFDVAVEGSVRSPRLGDPEQLSGIINGDAIIDERDEITVFIEDPLTKSAHLHISGSPITTSRFARAVGAFFQIAFREREKYGIGPEEDIGDYRIDGADRRPDGTWHLLIGV